MKKDLNMMLRNGDALSWWSEKIISQKNYKNPNYVVLVTQTIVENRGQRKEIAIVLSKLSLLGG
jgi:hypothetical protein